MNVSNKLPTIPDYFKLYVNPSVDLNLQPSQPCPFHNEKTGKSFSYSKQLNIWRCFGQCHCGGDVIDLHRLNYRLKNRDEAKRSLFKILGIDYKESISFTKEEIQVDEADIYRRRVYAQAINISRQSNDPDDWLALDYILSKVPYDVKELEVYCSARGQPVL